MNKDEARPIDAILEDMLNEQSQLNQDLREHLQQLLDHLRKHYGLDDQTESRNQSTSQKLGS
jgi:NurA-like 5'-3' nuclease